jgi:hypothetical protein
VACRLRQPIRSSRPATLWPLLVALWAAGHQRASVPTVQYQSFQNETHRAAGYQKHPAH